MKRFRLRAVAVLVSLFVPALGVCASLSPGVAFLAVCSSANGEGHSCCGEEPASCPAPGHVPQSPRCRACEGLFYFAAEDGPALRILGAAPPLPDSVVVAAPFFASFSPRHLQALSESPPLHLLNESLRN